jgi:hypothetical protein
MSTPNPLPSPRDVIILEEFRSLNSAHARLRKAGVSQATTDLLLRLLAALAEEAESGSKKS